MKKFFAAAVERQRWHHPVKGTPFDRARRRAQRPQIFFRHIDAVNGSVSVRIYCRGDQGATYFEEPGKREGANNEQYVQTSEQVCS